MQRKPQSGVSLLETVLYIGILAIVLPMITAFSIGLVETYNVIDPRTRMEQKAGFVFEQMAYDITSAEAIDSTDSVFGDDDGVLVFVDRNGETATIDRPTVGVDFEASSEQVRRLRLQRGSADPAWITDADIDVRSWRIQAVRDSEGELTGLNIHLEFQMLNPDTGAFRNAQYTGNTTYALSAHTDEQ